MCTLHVYRMTIMHAFCTYTRLALVSLRVAAAGGAGAALGLVQESVEDAPR